MENLQVANNDFLQMMPVNQANDWYNQFKGFVKSVLKSDLDYGTIPGTPKPTLYKAGAEKLRFVYGIGIETDCIKEVIDFDKPFVSFTYRCTAKSKTGQILSQSEGNCNSMEAKFAYVWKAANELPAGTDVSKLVSKSSGKKMFEFEFAIDKAETSGQYGKPEKYWDDWKAAIKSGKAKRVSKKTKKGKDMDGWEMGETVTIYRVNNPDVIGLQNTIMKMGIKRAFVAAILMATGASEFFTQDIEDMELNGSIYSDEVITVDAEVLQEEHEEIVIPDSWKRKAASCKTAEQVEQVITKNIDTMNAHPALLQFMEARKKELAVAPEKKEEEKVQDKPASEKPAINPKMYKEALARVTAGELDVYYKVTDMYSLDETQLLELKGAYDKAKETKNKK